MSLEFENGPTANHRRLTSVSKQQRGKRAVVLRVLHVIPAGRTPGHHRTFIKKWCYIKRSDQMRANQTCADK